MLDTGYKHSTAEAYVSCVCYQTFSNIVHRQLISNSDASEIHQYFPNQTQFDLNRSYFNIVFALIVSSYRGSHQKR